MNETDLMALNPNDPVEVEVEIVQVTSHEQLNQAFANFLSIDVAGGQASADTLATYRLQVGRFVEWCMSVGIQPSQATTTDIKTYRRYLVDRGDKSSTIALKLGVVRRFYQAAVEKQVPGVSVNPATSVKAPLESIDPAERITYLEKDELDLLLDTIPDDGTLIATRDRFMIALMAIEGPRTVELHRVNIGDIVRRGNDVGIQVQAKRSRRVVPLTARLAVRLEQYLELRRKLTGQELDPLEPLFISLNRATSGQRLSRRGIRKRVDHYLTLANLKHAPGRTLTAHSLRHTAGTLGLRAGSTLRQVQDLLGHKNPQTTAIYVHINDRWKANPGLGIDDKV
jgi:site-specific recombinase XerD